MHFELKTYLKKKTFSKWEIHWN